MGIGPIAALPPLTPIGPARGKPDLARVAGAGLLDDQRDDTYSPSRIAASRGLEDEETDEAQDADGADWSAIESSVRSAVAADGSGFDNSRLEDARPEGSGPDDSGSDIFGRGSSGSIQFTA